MEISPVVVLKALCLLFMLIKTTTPIVLSPTCNIKDYIRVIPNSAHAAFDKGCFYFNVEVRKARLNDQFVVDVNHVKSLIDSNTIMIVGSAPCFPYGTIDPIVELAKLAKKKNVGMHVDACLGGFIIVFAELLNINFDFNFKVDGVTSMSIDHHKYGLAPKGVSGLFFKTKELRGYSFFSYSEWCGGAYATPTMGGSRSGVATAGAWFVMNTITK
jgi:sphinganine-1-phosphate aldolase